MSYLFSSLNQKFWGFALKEPFRISMKNLIRLRLLFYSDFYLRGIKTLCVHLEAMSHTARGERLVNVIIR